MTHKHDPRTAATGVLLVLTGLLLSSCKSLEENASTDTVTPGQFKEGGTRGETPPTKWWCLFNDSQLNRLANQIESDNFQLKAGLARIDQAYAVLGISRAELVPNLNGSGSVTRNRTSANDLGGNFFQNYSTQYRGAIAAGWEVDLWGRVRNAVRGAEADALQVENLTDELRLSLQSQLAQNYFTLRFLDEEKRVLREALRTRTDNLDIARQRFEGELTGELDVARAQTELAATRADLARLKAPRTRLENAIAVLVGKAPSNFRIPNTSLDFRLPTVKAGLPLDVLESRPDVAAAIARLESTNAQIGVAKAEFFPRLDLVGSGGLSSVSSSNFFDWSSRTFAIGPEVTLPIFQGGRLKANLKGARAAQAEALATYQDTVLNALREVDDALVDLVALRSERDAQFLAISASNRALALSNQRYKEGLVSSIEVVDAVREQLTAERRMVQIRSQQYVATVQLIQAIGGGLPEKYTK